MRLHRQFSSTLVLAAVGLTIFCAPAQAQRAAPIPEQAQQNCQSVSALLKQKRDQTGAPTSGGQAAPLPADAPDQQVFPAIERKQIEMLETVSGQLANVVRRKALLYVCANDNVNAFAATVRGVPMVAIDLGLLELLRYERDAVAFVISHEYAHLLLGHTLRKGAEQADVAEAASAGAEYETRTARRGVAVIEALRHYDAKRAAYSRSQETSADDTGYQLMLEAGFNPVGALNAAKIILVTNGNSPFSYFASHPGWEERVSRIQQVVKFDVARREVADNAARRKTGEASYVSRAQELLAQRRWAALGAHVKDWQAAVEGSGAAWYYMGMHERGQRRQLAAAKEAFEKAVALDPEHEEALYMLCVTLHELKYRSESAYCGRDLKGAARYESFVDQQFGNRLWTSNPAPALPGKIWLAKEKDGSTLITNIDQLIELRGLNGVNVPLERQQLPWHAR